MIRAVRYLVVFAIATAAILLLARTAGAARCFYYSNDIGTVCDGRLTADPDRFEVPEPRPDSLLNRVTYAYMDDYIDIYPEPDLAVPPLYNVGRGFLYITVKRQFEANGHRWVEINSGEYALAEGIRIIETPTFQGVKVNVQPERPFGWIVQNVQPSSEPDGEPNPDYTEMKRFTFFQVFDAVLGEEEWIWYDIGDGRWIRQTYASLVDVHAPPEEVGPGEYWVEVDLYEQSFAAYEGERLVYAGLISSGLNRWPTYEGIFQVFSRYLEYKMSGAEGKIDYYFIEDVPYIMYFDRANEIALHGAYWHSRYGYKHSHGCVNMPPLDAEWIYTWSAGAPNDLWVWVHTYDPMSYFDRFRS